MPRSPPAATRSARTACRSNGGGWFGWGDEDRRREPRPRLPDASRRALRRRRTAAPAAPPPCPFRPSARPAPRPIIATLCSSASPATWWSASGSAMTTIGRCPAPPAAACRRGSGAPSCPKRSARAPAARSPPSRSTRPIEPRRRTSIETPGRARGAAARKSSHPGDRAPPPPDRDRRKSREPQA